MFIEKGLFFSALSTTFLFLQYMGEKADSSKVDISKTRHHTQKQSRLINRSAAERKNMDL